MPVLFGLSSASYTLNVGLNKYGEFQRADCSNLPLCEPIDVAAIGAHYPGRYCDLKLAYTHYTEPFSGIPPKTPKCKVGLLSCHELPQTFAG